jgi:hypothetical protein
MSDPDRKRELKSQFKAAERRDGPSVHLGVRRARDAPTSQLQLHV